MNRHRRLFVALLCVLVCVLALQWWDAARDAEAEAASAVVRERVRVEQAHHARAMAILDERIRRNQIELASARANPLAFDFEGLVDRTLEAYEAAAAEAVGQRKIPLETNARTLAWMLERAGFEREGYLRCYRLVRGRLGHFFMYSHVLPPL